MLRSRRFASNDSLNGNSSGSMSPTAGDDDETDSMLNSYEASMWSRFGSIDSPNNVFSSIDGSSHTCEEHFCCFLDDVL